MDINKQIDIFNSLSFKDVEPIAISESEIVLKHKQNNGIYKISYVEDDKGVITFDTTNAEVIQKRDKSKKEEFFEKVDELKNGIRMIFSEDYKDGVEALRKTIKESKFDVELEKEFNKQSIDEMLLNQYDEKILSKFGTKLKSYFEAEKEFVDSIEMFDESGDIKSGKFYSKAYITKELEESKKQLQAFEEDCVNSAKFISEISEVFNDDKASKEIFKNIKKDMKRAELTKLVVSAKTKYDESINIVESVGKIQAILESNPSLNLSGMVFNNAPSLMDRPKFLKLGFDNFSPDDLTILIEELTNAMAQYINMTAEQMQLVNTLKQKAEYMFNTRQICDHTFKGIIDTFNGEFGKSANLNL